MHYNSDSHDCWECVHQSKQERHLAKAILVTPSQLKPLLSRICMHTKYKPTPVGDC